MSDSMNIEQHSAYRECHEINMLHLILNLLKPYLKHRQWPTGPHSLSSLLITEVSIST